jgi:UDP-2-acetamido-3-amino-2,3-dideoxy-glucuronate N-acetyltransferase
MDNQLNSRVAVIGSGYWGKNLVRNFAALGTLGAICDKNEAVLEAFGQQYPGVETCMAFSQVLASQDIQGVALATPAETHYNLAREAILAGKHVYVEKPLTLELDQGQELIDLAYEHDRVLMVGHLLHYHPGFIKLKELAASGELGRINYIYSNRLNLGKIRREENILWSFAPHDISMILALAGEEPELVQATGGYYLHKKIADVTTTHLDFPSGLKAHIFVSWLHPFKEQKLVVVGDKKMAVFDDTQPLEDKLLLYPHQIIWENNIPVPAKAEAEKVPLEQGEPLKTECQEFLTCMGNGHRPTTDGREGLRVLKVLKAAQEALDNPGLGNSGIEGLRDSEIKGPRGKGQGPRTEATDNASQITDNRSRITDCFVHDTAVVDEPAEIGAGTKIWHFSHVLKNSRIGEKSNIGQNVVIGPDVTIGNQCKIQNNVSVYKGVTLEDGVFCGPSMVFTNIYNPRAEMSKMDQVRPTLVKHGATLGANCTIVCGATIGKYAFVGAGAVVTRDVPDHALVVGNPARQVGWMCVCGEKLSEDGMCESCGYTIKELRD